MNAAIIVSSFMAVCCIMMSVTVIMLWLPSITGPKKSELPLSVRWLVAGIVISFISPIIDNIWWGVAWALRYSEDPKWVWWFDAGVYANIMSRQSLKIIAAWCHVKAAIESGVVGRDFGQVCLFAAVAAGALAVIVLLML